MDTSGNDATGAPLVRIGFDGSQTGAAKAGCGYFAFSLADALSRADPAVSLDVYTSFGDQFFDPATAQQCTLAAPNIHFPLRHRLVTEAAEFWNAPNLADALGRPSVIHCNNFWCPDRRNIPGIPIVYTLYDLSFMIHPDWTTEANRLVCLTGMLRAAINADFVVSISEASRRDFLRHFPAFPADRVRVVYPASRFAQTTASQQAPKSLSDIATTGFWLSVGTIEPRKNQRALVEAYVRYRTRSSNPLPLVLAGGAGWKMETFRSELEQAGLGNSVRFTGYVSDAELAWLYSHCTANFYPSHFEGFGLPVLEGMTFGAPTVSSNQASLPEVCGDAAIQLSPADIGGWAECMHLLERDTARRDGLRASAFKQAAKFSWATTAAQVLDLYQQAIASVPHQR
ncbi:MAG: glycosyltransferase family 1 protein [Hyphomicrobiaceae bacterium]|nr:glycosyltransferase family 1 protein [Hyphomicrobiaceae bacterium]